MLVTPPPMTLNFEDTRGNQKSYIKEQFVCVGVLACLFDDASRHFQHYFSYILAVSFIG